MNSGCGISSTIWLILSVAMATFWLHCITTTFILLPWLRLRKVNVRAVTFSRHATRLYFNYSMSWFPCLPGYRDIDMLGLQLALTLALPSALPTPLSRNGTFSPPSPSQPRTSSLSSSPVLVIGPPRSLTTPDKVVGSRSANRRYFEGCTRVPQDDSRRRWFRSWPLH